MNEAKSQYLAGLMNGTTMNPGLFLPGIGPFPASLPPQMHQQMAAPGLSALYNSCRSVYPNQVNPLQVTAVTKFWLGGPDPLDFISMYSNPGNPEEGIPPHWHYISFGLSDLYGDGRIHPINGTNNPSGYGFELTFRLKKEEDEPGPPTWPAAVMQSLAKYVFQSDNTLCPGDHVSWHCSLDNSDSRIQHMLMTEDSDLGSVMTPFGSCTFVQIVGVCLEELQAAQQWNGPGLIDLMKSVTGLGGSALVTDMRRGESIFDQDVDTKEAVEDGINAEGSNLSGVTAKCSWSSTLPNQEDPVTDNEEESDDKEPAPMSPIRTMGCEDMGVGDRSTLSPNQMSSRVCSRNSRAHSAMSTNQNNNNNGVIRDVEGINELTQTTFLPEVHIIINLEGGNILPLALKGRLKHGRHFTLKTVTGDLAITLLTESVSGSYVSLEQPYAIHGPWLQVLIPNEFLDQMLTELNDIPSLEQGNLPVQFKWPTKNLSITIIPDVS